MTETNRGILTEADRDFLEKSRETRLEDYTLPAISQRKDTITKRVYYGLRDIAFLFHNLPDDQRRDAFERLERGNWVRKRTDILQFGAAFLMLGVVEAEDIRPDDEEWYSRMTELIIEKVLMQTGAGLGIPDNLNAEVTIEGWDDAQDGLSAVDPEELSADTLRFLLFRGEISNKEFAEGIMDQSDTE